jgi:hypothetical protein
MTTKSLPDICILFLLFRRDEEEEDRLRPSAQRGDTAAACDVPAEDDVTQPRNVPTLLSDGRRRNESIPVLYSSFVVFPLP